MDEHTLNRFLALEAAHRGGVRRVGARMVNGGRPMLPSVAHAVTQLIDSGHLCTQDRPDGVADVAVTAEGQERLRQLIAQRNRELGRAAR